MTGQCCCAFKVGTLLGSGCCDVCVCCVACMYQPHACIVWSVCVRGMHVSVACTHCAQPMGWASGSSHRPGHLHGGGHALCGHWSEASGAGLCFESRVRRQAVALCSHLLSSIHYFEFKISTGSWAWNPKQSSTPSDKRWHAALPLQ